MFGFERPGVPHIEMYVIERHRPAKDDCAASSMTVNQCGGVRFSDTSVSSMCGPGRVRLDSHSREAVLTDCLGGPGLRGARTDVAGSRRRSVAADGRQAAYAAQPCRRVRSGSAPPYQRRRADDVCLPLGAYRRARYAPARAIERAQHAFRPAQDRLRARPPQPRPYCCHSVMAGRARRGPSSRLPVRLAPGTRPVGHLLSRVCGSARQACHCHMFHVGETRSLSAAVRRRCSDRQSARRRRSQCRCQPSNANVTRVAQLDARVAPCARCAGTGAPTYSTATAALVDACRATAAQYGARWHARQDRIRRGTMGWSTQRTRR
ncbi:hypothetical protein B0O95_11242 [Mycetohabitans endofungorum]|uniref:Uncharacterized protein n=1 Tax=Mycetohabitans endofungorum TaxID=417203 RepID=A0A2P5K8D0_9BURK|nr:hypothetical protein B0O95_11242 [Mycetohabitans endofungorum]